MITESKKKYFYKMLGGFSGFIAGGVLVFFFHKNIGLLFILGGLILLLKSK